jgi:hypothetical protein
LSLTVNPTYTITQQHTVCEGDIFNFNGQNITSTGYYYDSLLTVNGCDSVQIINLYVAPKDTVYQIIELCKGETYNFFGNILSSNGSYLHILNSVFGCDSVILTNITVNALPQIEIDTIHISGNLIQLVAKGGITYQWSPSLYLNDPLIPNPTATMHGEITYIVNLSERFLEQKRNSLGIS